MPDPTPDQGEPLALQYLRAGFSVIPLDPNSKQPSARWLVNRSWRPFQSVRPSETIMLQWLSDPSLNWGVVCGQISGGLYCGDVDSPEFSAWVLDDPKRAIFQGACIVRSGSGKAHIWFVSPNPIPSTKWRLGNGHVGDVRGDGRPGAGGSYMVVPPSVHPDTGRRYEVVTGSLLHLPVITDGKNFLTEILRAYQGDPTVSYVEPDPQHTSKSILTLDDADRARVISRVRMLKLSGKIKDTLLTAGCQSPDSHTWERDLTSAQMSHSEIDFRVCCELIRKDQSFEETEEIFAATLVGDACYANKQRPNHGTAYLWQTYQAASKRVEEGRRSQRIASGGNFEVVRVARTSYGNSSRYTLDLLLLKDDGTRVPKDGIVITDDELRTEASARHAIFKSARCMLDFAAGHKGSSFYKFVAALEGMVSDVEQAPDSLTDIGLAALSMRTSLQHLSPRIPLEYKELRGMGWQDKNEGTYTVIAALFARTVIDRNRGFKAPEVREVLSSIGTFDVRQHLWPDGHRDQVFVITPHPQR